MNWFLYSLICLFGWGTADLFYKKGTDENDKQSHLKIAVWVGLIMGITSCCLIPFSESITSFKSLIMSAVKYLPASLGYIISMIIGYKGLRYLEMSIVSPIQNASGALSAIVMVIFFLFTGSISSISEGFSTLDYVGTAFVVVGVILIAIVEQKASRKGIALSLDNIKSDSSQGFKSVILDDGSRSNKKYKYGALALIFPLLYCLFDTIGTSADGIILNEETGLGLGEIDVLIIYGLTFFIAGVFCYIYMWIKNKKPYNPINIKETPKFAASICEEFGQIFYIFAMASNPILSAPLVSSYCIVSVIWSRIFLKEKLSISQYVCISIIICGIILLGISEGLSA